MTAQTPFLTHTFTRTCAQITRTRKVPNSFMLVTYLNFITVIKYRTREVTICKSNTSWWLSTTTQQAEFVLHAWEIVEVDVVN